MKVLLECKQDVPDFLDEFRPPGDMVSCEDDVTDDEKDDNAESPENAQGGVGVSDDDTDKAQNKDSSLQDSKWAAPEDIEW